MDRFFRGFIAGTAGGAAMNIESFFAYHVLQLTELRFLDWAAILIFGRLAANTAETVVALIVHLTFTGFLGIVFAFLVPQVTARLYLLKGVIFSLIIGFFIYATPVLFQTPVLAITSLGTVISNYAGGIIWGLVTAYTLGRLSREELAA